MAVTEVDHDQIKEKIVAILKASATLFDANNLAKIRRIEVGWPEGDPLNPEMMDHIFVTNGSPFEQIANRGNIVSNEVEELIHTFNYDIIVIVNGKTARDAENKLDDFQKLIMELLEVDANLTGVGTAEVDASWPVAVQPFQGDKGKPVKGKVITLRCIKTTG